MKRKKQYNLKNILWVIIPAYLWLPIIMLLSANIGLWTYNAAREINEHAVVDLEDNFMDFLALKQKRTGSGKIVVTDVSLPNALPPKLDRKRMKREGCVVDGLLSGYGNEKRNIALINRLPCYYLHRAVETWLDVPDWDVVEELKAQIVRSPMAYGMFIAEAINKDSKYINAKTGEKFRFNKMCKPGTEHRWGKDTCVPDFDRKEYRTYVTQIMKEAITHDIQVFLIGQVQIQDARHLDDSDIEDVLDDVRAYAKNRNIDIMIGAQTNDAIDKDYLRLFDFIEGGIGLHPNGSIEDGACFSRYLKRSNWCWALLWHEQYKKKANDIFVHLDWSGIHDDDMATFTLMDKGKRAETLQYLHKFFVDQSIGFLLPVFTALPASHSGCHGNKERYYSADKKYSCADEDVINRILTN